MSEQVADKQMPGEGRDRLSRKHWSRCIDPQTKWEKMLFIDEKLLAFHLVLIDNELKHEIIFHQTEIHQHAK